MSGALVSYGGEDVGYVPPTVTIASPADAAVIEAHDVTVLYTLAGDLSDFDHVDFTLDGAPHATVLEVAGSYTFQNVTPGPHTIEVEMADVSHVPLGNPEARASFSVTVVAPTPPTVVQDPQDVSVPEGQDATFSVTASGTLPLTYQWLRGGVDIGGATASSYVLPGVGPSDDGARFSVVVSNAEGSVPSAEAVLTVQPPNQLPTAAFTRNPSSGEAPLLVDFDGRPSDDPDGSIVSWDWDFGDGEVDVGETVLHTFTQSGNFLVTLTVTDDQGATDNTTQAVTVSSSLGWWDVDWLRRRQLTLDNATGAEALVDFPVLVRLDPSRIDYAVMAPDGSDLRFVDADNTTLLDHEIEVWNPGGESIVWVRVPEIDAASAGDFVWMYYGSPAAADVQNPAGVWQNGYEGVWHLVDGSDATVHGNDGVINGPVAVSGQVGGALDFDGADDYVEVPHDPSLAVTDSLMIEAWIRVADPDVGDAQRIVSKKVGWADNNGYNLEYNPQQNNLTNLGSGNNGGQVSNLDLDTSWHYAVSTITGSAARSTWMGWTGRRTTPRRAGGRDDAPSDRGHRRGWGELLRDDRRGAHLVDLAHSRLGRRPVPLDERCAGELWRRGRGVRAAHRHDRESGGRGGDRGSRRHGVVHAGWGSERFRSRGLHARRGTARDRAGSSRVVHFPERDAGAAHDRGRDGGREPRAVGEPRSACELLGDGGGADPAHGCAGSPGRLGAGGPGCDVLGDGLGHAAVDLSVAAGRRGHRRGDGEQLRTAGRRAFGRRGSVLGGGEQRGGLGAERRGGADGAAAQPATDSCLHAQSELRGGAAAGRLRWSPFR